MPGFDGTGPLGQGPMTGRGMGFCVLQESKDRPGQADGLAGLQGTPIGNTNANLIDKKEVINMPRGDGTGPAGLGPMIGRAAGFCAGYPVPGYMNPVGGRAGFYGTAVPRLGPYGASAYGYGAGYGVPHAGYANPWIRRGFGFGRGFGRGRGFRGGRGGFGRW
jgi:hypothetical protein